MTITRACSRNEASWGKSPIALGYLKATSLLYLSTAMCLMGTAAAWAVATRGTDTAQSTPPPAVFVTSTPAPTTRTRENGSAALSFADAGRNVSRVAANDQTSEALEIASNKSVTLRDEDEDDDSEDAGNDNGKEDNEDGDQAYNENENYLDSYDDDDNKDVKEKDEDGEEVDLDNEDGTA